MATSARTDLRFRLLGPLEVLRDGEPVVLGGERQRALLALLLLHANELVTTDRLAEQLFGSDASDASVRAVRMAVSRLRRLLDDDTLVTRPGGYLVQVEPGQLDVADFESLVAEGRAALETGEPEAASASFRAALALFRGPPLTDLGPVEFIEPEVRRLEDLRLSALMDRIDADLARGGGPELVPELEALAQAHPYQERLRAQLMLALYRSGRQADSLEVYRRTRELLAGELGLEPSRALQELERAVLQQDPALDPRGVVTPDDGATCPFKGLAPFEAGDALYFCGREQLLARIVARLASGTFVGIVGPSGVGKSSLLRAGLLPALAQGALPGSAVWRVLLVRGADRPTAELRAALDACPPGERVVLGVDQLEEVFAADVPAKERAAFLDELERAAAVEPPRAAVIVTVRADFYGAFAEHPRLAERLSDSQVFVRPLDRDELVRAIEVPAARAGLDVERPLVDALVADTAGTTAALPLLQTTLLQLWAERTGHTLRLETYRAIGGVRGAVARLAEKTYGRLSPDEQERARRIMLRLAGGDDGALVRRRVPIEAILLLDGARSVVDALVAARLLTVDEGQVELSHEALLHEWPRYRQWLEDDRVGRSLRVHVAASAAEWSARGREPADLYRGARLSAAVELDPAELSPLELEFLEAGRGEADRELRRQRSRNRRLRAALVGAAVLLGAAVVAGIVALRKSHAETADARRALARQLGAEAEVEPRIDRAMLLARESVGLDRSFQTEGTLLAALLRAPGVTGTFTMPIQDHAQRVAVSPDGRSIAVVTDTDAMRVFASRTHRETSSFAAYDSAFAYVPTSGDLLVVDPRPAKPDMLLVDPRSHHTLRTLTFSKTWQDSPGARDEPVVVTGDGRYAALFWTLSNPDRSLGPAYMELWRLDRGGPARLVRLGATGLVAAAALTGDRVAVATEGHLAIWDLRAGRRVRAMRGPDAGIGNAVEAVSPDGRTISYGLADGTVHFFDVDTGAQLPVVGGHSAPVEGIAFSPDSRLAASVGDDGLGILWNAATGQPVERLAGHVGRVLDAAFAPGGRTLYTASLDGTILEYDLSGARRFGSSFSLPPGHTVDRVLPLPAAPVLAVSGDGRLLAASPVTQGSASRSVQVVSAGTLRRVASVSLQATHVLGAAAWAGDRLVLGGDRGVVQMRDLANGSVRPLHGLQPRGAEGGVVRALAASRDGRVIAAADAWYVPVHDAPPAEEGALALWRDGALVGRPLSLGTFPDAAAVSPDGTTVAVATDPRGGAADGRALVVDASTGRVLRGVTPPHAGGSVTAVALSPNGVLATGTASGIVQLWNVRTGARIGDPMLVAPAPVSSIAFAPDGETFATSGGDTGGAEIWVTATRQRLGTDFPGGAGQWGSLAFTPDGSRLFAVFGDGTAYRWPVSLDAWERHACAVAGRSFTRAEWQHFVPGRRYAAVCG